MIASWSQDFHSIPVEQTTNLLYGNFDSAALMIFAYKEQPRKKMYTPQVIWTRKMVQETSLCTFNSIVLEPFDIGFYWCLTCRYLIVQPYKIYIYHESRKIISF